MLDGIRTDRAAVDDRYLIRCLNISTPFSSTDGEVRYDQRLALTNYKGMFLNGVPRSDERGRYWFQLRGSLINLANSGLHNNNFKDPFEILCALDDLITHLRIDPFMTPLNGLEISATIPITNPKRVCSSIVSYLNYPPSFRKFSRDGSPTYYVEVEAGQHTLKIYSPTVGQLRAEVKVNKMQFLGPKRPETFADLVQPCFAAPLMGKLLTAFRKIIWKCPDLNTDILPPDDRNLYQNGRLHEHWQVRRQDYCSQADFKRAEKQRGREKESYKAIVERYWLSEPPDYLECLIREQLDRYEELMHTRIYQTLVDVCLERWHYLANLPDIIRLPNRLKLPPLSEIYPLYLSKPPTTFVRTSSQFRLPFDSCAKPDVGVSNKQCKTTAPSLSQESCESAAKMHRTVEVDRTYNRQRQRVRNDLHRIEKAINVPGGTYCALDEMTPMLSVESRIALAHRSRSLIDLKYSDSSKLSCSKLTTLFAK